jgi:glutaredoxin
MAALLKLFIKSGCGWCDLAEDWLREHGYQYSAINVTRDRAAYDEMIRLSGQRLAPTLQVGELILPDFGPDELAQFLKKHSITP